MLEQRNRSNEELLEVFEKIEEKYKKAFKECQNREIDRIRLIEDKGRKVKLLCDRRANVNQNKYYLLGVNLKKFEI